jgi:TPR repeat protein
MANLAVLHREGRGTPRDSERAYFWARAAERSWARAHSAARGVGSSQSLAEFTERAARGLDSAARARLDAEVGEFLAALPSRPSADTMLAAQGAE